MKELKYIRNCVSLILALVVVSCGGDDDDDDNPALENTRSEIQTNVGTNIILPAYRQLVESSSSLKTEVEAFIQNPDQVTLESARDALQNVRLDWQDASIYQFGPAEEVTLRSSLNTYPTDDEKIEANVASGEYVLESIDNRDAVGFPAIDYLINGSAESDQGIIELFVSNAQATARKQYLTELAETISDKTQTVLSAWEASGENYIAVFTSPDASGTDVGSSLGILVNALNLQFEKFTRDGKVAIPAGIRSAGVPRPLAIEAVYTDYSVELLLRSLNALRKLYIGENGLGLQDYLVELGEDELANDILQQMDLVINDSGQLTDPLSELIETNNDQLLDLFVEMQSLVVLMKADMASVMGITITFLDNDGD